MKIILRIKMIWWWITGQLPWPCRNMIYKGLEDFGQYYVVRVFGIVVFKRTLRLMQRKPYETDDEFRSRRHKDIMDCNKTTGYNK